MLLWFYAYLLNVFWGYEVGYNLNHNIDIDQKCQMELQDFTLENSNPFK